ncbi:MAG TPA: DUF2231 domain-containing protein [Candidatus Anoxymicrobiaceae bacterium]
MQDEDRQGAVHNAMSTGGRGQVDERVPAFLQVLLERFPIFRREPHLATIHFPLVFAVVTPLFDVLYVLRPGKTALEKTSFNLLVLGVLATPVAMITGLFTWWLNFKATLTRPVKVKMSAALLLLADMIALLTWRLSDRRVMDTPGRSRTAYLGLSISMPILATILGRFGGKLSGHVVSRGH